MKLRGLIFAGLATLVGVGSVAIANGQTPYTEIPQPVDRIDPSQPTQIQLHNHSGLPLEYSFIADEIEPRRLSAGDSITLSNFSLPASIVVNPTQARVNLKYDLVVVENTAILKLRRVSPVTPGNRAFDIQQTGSIYVY